MEKKQVPKMSASGSRSAVTTVQTKTAASTKALDTIPDVLQEDNDQDSAPADDIDSLSEGEKALLAEQAKDPQDKGKKAKGKGKALDVEISDGETTKRNVRPPSYTAHSP